MPKIVVRVSMNFKPHEWEQARQFLSAAGRPDLARAPRRPFGYTLKFGNEDELAQFKAVAELFGFAKNIGPVGREKKYLSHELASAKLLSVFYTRSARGLGGPESGTEYDFEAGCPCCDTGARQTSDLLIKGRLPENTDVVETLTGEWLLTRRLAALLSGCLNTVRLGPVRNKRGREALPWVQLLPTVTLPRLEPTTRGIKVSEQCECCLRDGHFDTVAESFEPHYERHVFEEAYDAAFTWEHFGLSRLRTPRSETVLARPRLFVSSRLFKGLRAQNVRGLDFIPASCDESSSGANGSTER